MAYAFILPDACRAAEAALAQLTANIITRRDTTQGNAAGKLTPEDIDLLRGRINAARLKLIGNAYLQELWPAPHVAIGVKNNLPLVYAVHVVGQVVESLRTLMADLVPTDPARGPLDAIAGDMADVGRVLENALAIHLRRKKGQPVIAIEPLVEANDITIGQVVARYLDYMLKRVEVDDLAPDNFKNIKHDLVRFAAAFGTQAVSATRQHDMTAWFDQNPQWRAVHTRRRVATYLLACFRWAAEEEIIAKCPFRTPRAARGIAPRARRPAERREYVALMWKGGRQLRLALFFLRRTGARTCEMRAVRWCDLRLDDAFPHARLDKHKTARATGASRIIPLDKTTVRVLAAVKRRVMKAAKRAGIAFTGEEQVFLNSDGGPWDRHTFGRHLRRTAKRIGIDAGIVERITGYTLRHMFATEAIEAGVGIRQVADVLGHSKTDVVSTFYASHTRAHPEHLSNVVEEIHDARRARRKKATKKPGTEQ